MKTESKENKVKHLSPNLFFFKDALHIVKSGSWLWRPTSILELRALLERSVTGHHTSPWRTLPLRHAPFKFVPPHSTNHQPEWGEEGGLQHHAISFFDWSDWYYHFIGANFSRALPFKIIVHLFRKYTQNCTCLKLWCLKFN